MDVVQQTLHSIERWVTGHAHGHPSVLLAMTTDHILDSVEARCVR